MSICFTLITCTFVYCSVAIVLTLMVRDLFLKETARSKCARIPQVPYYLLNPDAALPEAFLYANLPAFKYIIGAGALTGQ